MPRYQYWIISLGSFSAAEAMAGTFGKLGSAGWQLVAMYDKGANWFVGMEKGFAIFQREVAEGVDEPDGGWSRWDHAFAIAIDPNLGPNPSKVCRATQHASCKRSWCTCRCHAAGRAAP